MRNPYSLYSPKVQHCVYPAVPRNDRVPSLRSGFHKSAFPHQSTYRHQKLFIRKWLHYVAIRTLLLGPELVTLSVLGTHHDHRNARIVRVALKFAARLETIALRHHHVHQNQIWTLDIDRLLQAHRIMDRNRHITGAVQHRLHELHFGRRIIDDQNLGQTNEPLPLISRVGIAIAQPSYSDRKGIQERHQSICNQSLRKDGEELHRYHRNGMRQRPLSHPETDSLAIKQ